jgi:hypothetical protein
VKRLEQFDPVTFLTPFFAHQKQFRTLPFFARAFSVFWAVLALFLASFFIALRTLGIIPIRSGSIFIERLQQFDLTTLCTLLFTFLESLLVLPNLLRMLYALWAALAVFFSSYADTCFTRRIVSGWPRTITLKRLQRLDLTAL